MWRQCRMPQRHPQCADTLLSSTFPRFRMFPWYRSLFALATRLEVTCSSKRSWLRRDHQSEPAWHEFLSNKHQWRHRVLYGLCSCPAPCLPDYDPGASEAPRSETGCDCSNRSVRSSKRSLLCRSTARMAVMSAAGAFADGNVECKGRLVVLHIAFAS